MQGKLLEASPQGPPCNQATLPKSPRKGRTWEEAASLQRPGTLWDGLEKCMGPTGSPTTICRVGTWQRCSEGAQAELLTYRGHLNGGLQMPPAGQDSLIHKEPVRRVCSSCVDRYSNRASEQCGTSVELLLRRGRIREHTQANLAEPCPLPPAHRPTLHKACGF